MRLQRRGSVQLWALTLVALAATAHGATFELTRETLSRTAIVVGPEPSGVGRKDGDSTWIDRFAARELARYLGLALGATEPIPIVSADEVVGWPVRIAIGGPQTNAFIRRLCRAQRERFSSYTSEGKWLFEPGADFADGFVIIATEDQASKTLVLGGNLRGGTDGEEASDPPTLYAVYHFLETFVDCGFFPDGAHVARRTRVTVVGEDVQSPRFRDRFYRLSLAVDGPQAFSPRKWSQDEWAKCFQWMVQRKLNIALIDLSGADMPSPAPGEAFALARRLGVRFAFRIDEAAFSRALERNALPEMLGHVAKVLGPADYWILPLAVRLGDEPDDLIFQWSDVLAAVEAVSHQATCLLDASAWARLGEVQSANASDPLSVVTGFMSRWLGAGRSLYVFDPFSDIAPWRSRDEEREARLRGLLPHVGLLKTWGPRAEELDARLRELLSEGLQLTVGFVHSYAQDQQIHGDLETLARRVRDAAREPPSSIPGLALLLETPGHNYAYRDFAVRLAWDPWNPATAAGFFDLYARRRFGGRSAARLAEAEALAHEATRAYCLPFVFQDSGWPPEASTGRMFYRNPFGLRQSGRSPDGGHPEFFPLLADREAWLEARERIWRVREVCPRLARAVTLYLSCADEYRDSPLYRDSLVELFRTYLGELNNRHLAVAYRAYRAATEAFSSPSRDPVRFVVRFEEEAARALRCLTLLATLESADPRFSAGEPVDGVTVPTVYSTRWLVEVALPTERAYCGVLADRLRARRPDPLASSQWMEVELARARLGAPSMPAVADGSCVDEAVRILSELAVDAGTGLDISPLQSPVGSGWWPVFSASVPVTDH